MSTGVTTSPCWARRSVQKNYSPRKYSDEDARLCPACLQRAVQPQPERIWVPVVAKLSYQQLVGKTRAPGHKHNCAS